MPSHRSTCPLDCPDRCSLRVTVGDDGGVEAIDGDQRQPLTQGYICAKVRRFHERLTHPLRVTRPAVRVGPKGPGARFVPVSWDEAIELVASRFRHIVETDGAEAILPVWYGGSNGKLTGGGLDQRFWDQLGATRVARTLCAANTGAGARMVYDDLPGADLLDVADANGLILWGVNPSASGMHLVPLAREAQRRGFLAVVDPRATPLARQADIHLPVLPGTDVVVALALARLAFDRGLADEAFLAAHAADTDALRTVCAPWTPARAASVAGVRAADIEALAERYASAAPALIRLGWGLERNRNGTDAVRAVLSLPAVYGKFGVRGGGFCASTSAGYRVDRPAPRPPLPRQVNLSQLSTVLAETRDPPFRAVYVYNGNPVATWPDQLGVAAQLARDDLFVVVHEQVHTDTCDYADVLLPATTFLEHRELSTSYGGYVLQWAEPAVAPVGEARSNHAVFRHLAAALGLPGLEIGEEALARELVGTIGRAPAGAWSTLRREGVVPLARPVQFGDVFPSRPVTFCAPTPPRFRPLAGDGLWLISPASRHAITSTLFELRDDPRVDIHPHDAAPRGIADGDLVRLSNALGVVEVHARVTDEVRPGVVSLVKGLWRRSVPSGTTGNALVASAVDEHGGGACYNDVLVAVTRA